MPGTVIIQRIVPHYRVPLFRELHRRYGVRVVAASNPPTGTGLKFATEELGDIVVTAPFVFPDPQVPERARFPIDWILDKLAPDTIVGEFALRNSSAWGLPCARRRGRFDRLVVWTHGWMMERGFRKPIDLLSQYARLAPFAAADVIATYGEEGAAWVRRMLPWKPVVALGNPLDQTVMRNAAATATPIRHGEPQLLAVGRLKADKGFDLVLDVFRRVRAQLPNAALTIIGSGSELPRLRERAGADLGKSIHLPGAVYEEADLAGFFLGADAFVLGGAAGLSVNHALAYDLPVVAFPRMPGGPRHHPEIEYVVPDETGFLVDDFSAAAMGDAIAAAWWDGRLSKLRRAMSQRKNGPTVAEFADSFGRALEAAHRKPSAAVPTVGRGGTAHPSARR